MDDQEFGAGARKLGAVIEPFAGQVYFSPECHAEYVTLGFSPSPATRNGVALPDGPAYSCSRGSLLGQVPGDLVASAFAVFNPAVVVPAVTFGLSVIGAAAIEQARTAGAVAQLTRILGPDPAGLGRSFTSLSTPELIGIMLALMVVCLAGGHATIRRVPV